MKKIVITYVLFILTLYIYAQNTVPGYMGKRVSIGYSNDFSVRFKPGIINTFASSFNKDVITGERAETDLSLNSTHCLDLDYIVGTKTSLCFSAQYTKLNVCAPGKDFGYYTNGTESGNLIYRPVDDTFLKTQSIGLSFGFKFFRKRYQNPYGRYRKVEFIMINNSVKTDQSSFVWDYSSTYSKPKDAEIDAKQKSKGFVIAYTVGRQRIYYDKMILDIGLRFGLESSRIFRGLLYADSSDYISSTETPNEVVDRKLKTFSRAAVFESQLVNFHIGLRFLAF